MLFFECLGMGSSTVHLTLVVSADPRAHLYSWAEGTDIKDIVAFSLLLGDAHWWPPGPASAWAWVKLRW